MASTSGVSYLVPEPALAAPPLAPALAAVAPRGRDLAPSNRVGLVQFGVTCGLSAGGVAAALAGGWALWGLGQLLLALAGLRWFLILHEAGHRTLFRTRAWNRVAGWLAGLWSGIPSSSWRRVHAGHHRWAGWEDRDPTRAGLARAAPRGVLGGVLALAWRAQLPLLALLYRRAFWRGLEGAARLEALVQVALWVALVAVLGPAWCLKKLALGVALGLVLQEWLILSQHTHLPQVWAGSERVRPFSAADQGRFTRSLRVPGWLSWLLLGAEAHSLHHRFPQVPGYRLRLLEARAEHEALWREWLLSTRRHAARHYLFSTHEDCPECASLTPSRRTS